LRGNLIRSTQLLKPLFMRRASLALLVGLASLWASIPLAFAQVATDPVGFTTTTVQSGTIAALGMPFDRVADFQGAVSSRTATTITTTSAGFGTFGPFASSPHAVLMISGANTGRRFLIDSNTTDTLTITTGGDLTTQIADGDTYKIIPCHTLASLFGTDGAGLNVSNSAASADNVQLREGGAWLTYFHTANPGGFWAKVGGGATNFNNHAILPEQALLLVRRPSSDFAFTGTGAVPITNLKTDFPANAVTSFANRFPTDTTLVALGLHLVPSWISSNSANSADQVLIRTGGAWLTYFHTAGGAGFWAKVGGGATNFDNTAIPIGTSVLIVRRPGTDITLTQTLPYTL
jgi:uncharacterized protein (TIGR02597 family)